MEVKEGYKQTEVGVIPDDWNFYKIQDLIDSKYIIGHLDGNHGELYPRSHEFKESGIPYIAANDFADGVLSFEGCKFISKERASLFKKGIAVSGDVLFAHNATVGPVALLKIRLDFVILSTTATYFRCNPDRLSNKYLLYALQAPLFVKQYQAVMSQSTRNQVPISAQRKFSIVLPPTKAEQTAIATTLSDIDALIQSLEKLIAKNRNIKQGAMQELLKPKEGWRGQKLGDVAPLQRGFDLPKSQLQKGDYPVVYSNGIENYHSTFQAKAPGVVTGRSGTIGKVTYVEKDYWPHNTALWVTDFKGNNPKFIFYLYGYIHLERFETGSGVPTLNRNDVHAHEVSVPSVETQTTIATILSDVDAEISALETKLAKYKQIKQGMMQNLLTGKIRLV